ncbi:hypothetical protein FACS1894187_23960 [Synergistales bacterium]|nr:hypothetical protein FACS1894187_23960 [Synergistales bacterium]
MYNYRMGRETEFSNYFEREDIVKARQYRRGVSREVIKSNEPFDIAQKFGGTIVLAHPIHTSLKSLPKDNLHFNDVRIELERIMCDFIDAGGKVIEWEYVNENKNLISKDELFQLRQYILEFIKKHSLYLTMGSDAHTIENYINAERWLN